MLDNEKTAKKPISQEWRKKFDDGKAIILAAEKGTLIELFKGFPKDMDFPAELLKTKGKNDDNFIHVAAAKGHLDQVTHIAKEHNLDILSVLSQRNFRGETPIHVSGRSGSLVQLADMANQFDFKNRALFFDTNKDGENWLHLAIKNKHLNQTVTMVKEYDINIGYLLIAKNSQGQNIAHMAAGLGIEYLKQFADMAKALKKDVVKLLTDVDKHNRNFAGVAKDSETRMFAKQMQQEMILLAKQEKLKKKAFEKMQDFSEKTEQYKALPINSLKSQKGSR